MKAATAERLQAQAMEEAKAKFFALAKPEPFFGGRMAFLKPGTSNPRKSITRLLDAGFLVSVTLRAGGQSSTYLVQFELR